MMIAGQSNRSEWINVHPTSDVFLNTRLRYLLLFTKEFLNNSIMTNFTRKHKDSEFEYRIKYW